MLDINQYFFWQLINFILLFLILNQFLFKPFLRLFKEREDHTKGALERARSLDKEKDELLSQIDSQLSEARNRARLTFEGLSKEGLEEQRKAIKSTQDEAVEINRKAKLDIEAAVEKARTALKLDIENFARQIVDKLAGV